MIFPFPPYSYGNVAAIGGSVAFNPNQITGLKMALYGSNLVGADGTAITTWPDPDASSNPTQATALSRPTLKKPILNGLPVARFLANQLGTAAPVTTALVFTVFLVFNQTTGGTTQEILTNGSNSGGNGVTIYLAGSSIPFLLFNGVTQINLADSGVSGWTILGVRYSSGTANYHRSGDSPFFQSIAAPILPTTTTSIGAGITAANNPFTGDIFSALVWDNDIGATNFSNVFNYLSTLTGIAP